MQEPRQVASVRALHCVEYVLINKVVSMSSEALSIDYYVQQVQNPYDVGDSTWILSKSISCFSDAWDLRLLR